MCWLIHGGVLTMPKERALKYPYPDALVIVTNYGQNKNGHWNGTVGVQPPDGKGWFVAPREMGLFDEKDWALLAVAAAAKNGKNRTEWIERGKEVRIGLHDDLVNGASASTANAPASWPDILPLPADAPVPHLSPDLLPDALRGWFVDIADLACFPLEFVAIPAFIGLGAVVGRAMGIKPTQYDDFIAIPNLWGAVVGRPGVMKSYAVDEGLKPLSRLAATAHDRYEAALVMHEAGLVQLKGELAGIEERLKDEAKKESADKTKLNRLKAEYSDKKREIERAAPIKRRYQTQDATVEKLGDLLRDNPRGLLIVRDELAGWLRTLDKAGREGDREFYLEAWNGTGSYTVDRIGRGEVHIRALCVSICGGIQPSKLNRYIADAIGETEGADGLLQRLQLLVWPEDFGEWCKPERWADKDAKARAYKVFEWLDSSLESAGLPVDTANSIPALRFCEDAQELFDSWREELERRVRSNELKDAPAFESHLAKYRSLLPSLALLLHLVDVAGGEYPGPVSWKATQGSMLWCDFLEAHARRVYSAELNPGVGAARLLAEKINEGKVADGQSIRDIYRPQWSGLR
jgi:hypothetical protein